MAGAQGKIPKTCPEVAVFAGDVPYISEMFPYEKQNLPYITQIDRLEWGYYAKRSRAITRCGLQQRGGAWLGS